MKTLHNTKIRLQNASFIPETTMVQTNLTL